MKNQDSKILATLQGFVEYEHGLMDVFRLKELRKKARATRILLSRVSEQEGGRK